MPDFLTKVIKLEILKPLMWVGGTRDGQPCDWKELGETLRTVRHLSARIVNQFVSEKYTQTQLACVSSSPAFDSTSCSGVLIQRFSAAFVVGTFSREWVLSLNTFLEA